MKFVKPDEISKMDHVPQLEVGMYRVLVSQETEETLVTLREHGDYFSKIRDLIIGFLEYSIKTGDLSKSRTSEDFWRDLRWKLWNYVENGHVDMAHLGRGLFGEVLHSILTAVGASSPADVVRASLPELKSVTIDALVAAKSATAENTRNNIIEERWEGIMSDL
jgi:hypothetical protein